MKSYSSSSRAPARTRTASVQGAALPETGEELYPPAAVAAHGVGRPTISLGSTGNAVRLLQQELNRQGFPCDVDGIFGPLTDRQVRAFQRARDLDDDGIVGSLTWGALLGGTSGTGTGTGTGTNTGTGTGTNTGTGTGTGTNTGTGTGTNTGTGTGQQVQQQEPEPQSQQAQEPQLTVASYLASLPTLPREAAMSPAQRAQMYAMTAQMTIAQIKVCFQHRFGVPMGDDSAAWTVPLARAVWAQLDLLPDGHVTDNTVLTAFRAISGFTSYGPSWEAPNVINTIQIGAANDPAHLGHTVRHEVGHAVHADPTYRSMINTWLERDVGFWFYPGGAGGLRQWVMDLGGFGAASSDQSDAIVQALVSYVGGGGSWDPARPSFTDGLSADLVAVWNAMPATVREAVAQSVSSWYSNWRNFGTGARGKYFLNYWYARGYFMGPTAEQAVAATGSYSAMSEAEFFANCYAEFFKNPAGFADPDLWGGNLPASVKGFFREHILERQPYQPPGVVASQQVQPPPKPTGMPGTP